MVYNDLTLINNLPLAFGMVMGSFFALVGLVMADEDVERLVRQGEKMLAIRLYRELHGTDLKVSRLRVEEISSRLAGK